MNSLRTLRRLPMKIKLDVGPLTAAEVPGAQKETS